MKIASKRQISLAFLFHFFDFLIKTFFAIVVLLTPPNSKTRVEYPAVSLCPPAVRAHIGLVGAGRMRFFLFLALSFFCDAMSGIRKCP
jgi:hypothetical protein